MRIQAIIFDMDGVLSDTELLHGEVQEKMLLQYGISLPAKECSRRFAGVPEPQIWPVVFAEAGIPCPDIGLLMDEKIRRMMERLSSHVPAVHGSVELIGRMHALGLPCAVASSAPRTLVETTLTGLGVLSMMSAIVVTADVEHGKPAPDIFLHAAKLLGIAPKHCLVIEDARAGVEAAKAAGMTCIGLKSPGSEQDLSMADTVITSLNEITEEMLRTI
ncbi:MAG: HAD family phosphatase [Candidatus Peribacteraceae bacterium]